MITVREGLPGGGKTLSAVGEDILPALIAGRKVVTNINLNADRLELLAGRDLAGLVDVREEDGSGAKFFSKVEHFEEVDKWRSDGESGKGPLIVVDECHEVLKAPGYANKADESIANWMALHRHKGVDVTLISQSFDEIPAGIRRRVSKRFWYRKAGFLSMPGAYFKKTFVGAAKKPVHENMGRYPKQWFGLYRSVDADVIESLPKERNILLNSKLIFLLLVLIAIISYILWNGVHLLGSRGIGTQASDKITSQDHAPGQQAAAESATDEGPKLVKPVAGGMLGAGHVEPSQELLNLQDQISIERAKHELALVKTQRPSHDELDGKSAIITGYMAAPGDVTYFVKLSGNNEAPKVVRAEDLVQFGFKVTAVDRCTAFLRGDRGIYRLTCDVPARFGKAEDSFRAGRMVAPVIPASTSVEFE